MHDALLLLLGVLSRLGLHHALLLSRVHSSLLCVLVLLLRLLILRLLLMLILRLLLLMLMVLRLLLHWMWHYRRRHVSRINML